MTQTIEIEISQNGQPTKEIVSLFPKQGEWTEDDYFRLPETNRIIELSEGRLIITPSPTEKHQRISLNLLLQIANYVKTHKLGEVRHSPLDVRLYRGVIREPDIVFMSNEHRDRITEKYWGVPDLIVEILSESTEKEDRVTKFFEYLKAGVSEYWIVDPFRQTIEVFVLENETYVTFGKWGIGETAKSKLLDGLEVNVKEVID
ncbi:TPA: Uma2 family endonuclease [Candidatus Poribacteria bacterium]|nr:Uma2 family endonuclease [Candidatus Poribacteria bacterium]